MAHGGKALMGLSVKAMIFFEGKLLLLQKNDGQQEHHWEFPGGGVDEKETFLMALRREVEEETGLAIDVAAPVGTWTYEKRDGQFLNGVIFTARSQTDVVRLSSEHLAYHWVTPEEFLTYRIHGSLWRALLQMQVFDYDGSQELLHPFIQAMEDEHANE